MKTFRFLFAGATLMMLLMLPGFSPFVSEEANTSFKTRSPNSVPCSGTGYSAIESKIDQLAQNAVISANIPGMTLAVSKDGRLVFNKAYGYSDYPNKKPMSPWSKTQIGSISKMCTAAGVMKLTEEKPAFNINKKVYGPNGVFKDWKDYDTKNAEGKPEWYAKIQMKHLLSHTAGFDGGGDPEGAAKMFNVKEEDLTYKQIHQHFLKNRDLKYEPGTDFDYSNHGMGFCGHILSEVSGMPYHSYIINKILKPLGLEGRVTPYSISIDKYMAGRHKLDDNGKIEKMDHSPTNKVSTGLAAGGWAATARDMVRFMVATDKLTNYPDILKPATIDLMEAKPFPAISGSHAIGWGIQVRGSGKKLSHNGKLGGGTARIVKFTKGYISSDNTDLSNINLAVCTNGDVSTSALGELLDEIAKVVGKANIPANFDLFQTNVYDAIVPGDMRFTGVFLQKENPSVLRVCESWADFTETWSDFGKKGLRLADAEAEKVNGNLQYAGVWEKGSGKHALYQFDSWAGLTQKWDELGKKDYRLIDIERLDGGMYLGVWTEGKGNHALYQYKEWDDFTKKWKELGEKGYRLIDIEAYDAGDNTNYIGVWGAGADKYALYSYDSWEAFNTKWSELSGDNYRLID
ncbi:MAG: serine hydrolase, partial [Thermoanaerobaculia bacterium]|nr:serine hydrolase [Thermoanaerobaculia bacterium]